MTKVVQPRPERHLLGPLLQGRGLSLKLVSEFEGVYADSLHRVIEGATGLRTSL